MSMQSTGTGGGYFGVVRHVGEGRGEGGGEESAPLRGWGSSAIGVRLVAVLCGPIAVTRAEICHTHTPHLHPPTHTYTGTRTHINPSLTLPFPSINAA